eukprot:4104571-Amphidinium_carterae.2
MVLAASGRGCAFELREAFKAVRSVLLHAGMQLNKSKCVVVANTDQCRLECRRAWHRMGVQVAFHTRDLGVDVQWGPWNPVQQSRIKSFTAAMTRVRMLNLPRHLTSQVRVSARRALGRGAQLRRAAELELALKGGIKADLQVTLDLYTIRAWQRALLEGQLWPPSEEQWTDAAKG